MSPAVTARVRAVHAALRELQAELHRDLPAGAEAAARVTRALGDARDAVEVAVVAAGAHPRARHEVGA